MAAKVPRNFRLLEELEKGEKGLGAGMLVASANLWSHKVILRLEACSYGLSDGDDLLMSNWNGTILGPPHSAHENRIYSLNIHCGDNYPDAPPTVLFVSKINLPCVDQRTGRVDPSRLPCLLQWKRENTMETILIELRSTRSLPNLQKEQLSLEFGRLTLFRALIRQGNRLPFDQRERASLDWSLKTTFKKNASLNSHQKIVAALRLGYQLANHDVPKTLKIFRRLDEHPDKLRRIFDFLATPTPRMPSTIMKTSQTGKKQTSRSRRYKIPRPLPRVWPHPDNKLVFSRPFPNLSGRRHVPKFRAANGVPFLLFKKPQSRYLARIIRDQIKTREKRGLLRNELESQILLGREEDLWDRIMESTLGIQCKYPEDEGSWGKESSIAANELKGKVHRQEDRVMMIASKMQGIVKEEQTLADVEKCNRKNEKKRMRRARKEVGSSKIRESESLEARYSKAIAFP
ncbi:E2 ubiquitin-conjugating protein mms2 [Sticta canariensis]|nr:E2 ubiquitin-conjugating protein mms2 [Sticta canariensis]